MYIKILIYLTIGYFLPANATEWSEFVSRVEEAINKSSTYTFPINNKQYFSNTTRPNDGFIDFGAWDFIIAGGGTAGGVLANRLTEENFTVLVIEAGKQAPFITDILGLRNYLIYSDTNWGYNTTRQKNACLASRNQQCFYPRGKALGGSSVLNSGMYVRGNADDFDRWAKMGNKGWSYKECLPYFKKSERADFFKNIDAHFHGFGGLQNISMINDTPILTSSFLEAFQDFNLKLIDLNGKSNVDGVGRIQYYLDYKIRSSTAHSFLRNIQSRKNLHITTDSLVTKVRLSSNKAEGVEFIKDGKRYFAKSKKEVIVSGGSVNTPQILMLSGIGPSKELLKHKIPLVAELPVGENLMDHLQFPAIYVRTNQTLFNNTLEENLILWKSAERPLTGSVQVAGFIDVKPENRSEVVEFFVGMASKSYPKAPQFNDDYTQSFSVVNDTSDLLITIVLLHPKSVGQVTLQSDNPKDFALIDTNYLTDPRDLETIYEGVQKFLNIDETDGMKRLNAEIYTIAWPGCDGKYEKFSKDWWYCGIRHVSYTVYHPIGTARMGKNPKESVVNSNLKVHGFDNLRVVDASVMPSTVSGHTNAAVVMIAEKIADEIKSEHLF